MSHCETFALDAVIRERVRNVVERFDRDRDYMRVAKFLLSADY
jgi:hypothetical protein